MRIPKLPVTYVTLLLIMFSSLSLRAQDNLTEEDQQRIEESIAPIRAFDAKVEEARATIVSDYIAQLDALVTTAKEASNFKGALRIQEEKKEWEAGKGRPMDLKDDSIYINLRQARFAFEAKIKNMEMQALPHRKKAIAEARSLLKIVEGAIGKQDRFAAAVKVAEVSKNLERSMPSPLSATASAPSAAPAPRGAATPAAPAGKFPFKPEDVALYLNFESVSAAGRFTENSPEKKTCLLEGSPTFGEGPRGKAIRFTTPKDRIVLPPIQLSTEITIMGWVKHERPNSWGHLVKLGDENKQAELSIHSGGDGKSLITSMSRRGSDVKHCEAPNACDIGRWMHLMATCDKHGEIRMYKNGKLILKDRRSGTISPHIRRFGQIGRDFDVRGKPASSGVFGMMDEILILRRVVGAREADKVYRAFGGR